MGLFSRKKNEEAAVEVTKTPEKKVDIKSRMKAIKEVGRFSIEQKNKLFTPWKRRASLNCRDIVCG